MRILPQLKKKKYNFFFKVAARKALPQKAPSGPPSPHPGPTTMDSCPHRAASTALGRPVDRIRQPVLVRIGGFLSSASSFKIVDHTLNFTITACLKYLEVWNTLRSSLQILKKGVVIF